MAKAFNITGTCIPDIHYMANMSKKLDQIIKMAAKGNYFTINKPRQYGKTTVMYLLEQRLIKDKAFLERNGRLLFLAFLRPIINGKGFDFKEVQISEEKRLDVVITIQDKKYIIELKIWRGESYHQTGIGQLCDYLDRQNQTTGYLLIYDLRKESGRVGECERIEIKGKEIFTAWV